MERTPARPGSEDWIGELFGDVHKAVEDIEEQTKLNNQKALERLSAEFDADIETRRRKEKAIARRDITLKKAWLAQTALKENSIPMDDWIGYQSNYDIEGLFKHTVIVEKRIPGIAINGWALDYAGGIILTTDPNNPLAVVETTTDVDDWIRKYDRCIVVARHGNYTSEIRSTGGARYFRPLTSIAHDDNSNHKHGVKSVNGAFDLLNVQHQLIPIKNLDIDEDNTKIGSVRKKYLDFIDGDFDKSVQSRIARLVAEKIINPEDKLVIGRSF